MKILTIITFFWLFGPLSTRVFAISLDEVVLEELSSSQKSLVINRGELEKYKEGSFAKFFIQNNESEIPKIFLVAEGKLVKSFPKKSYWYLSQTYLPKMLLAGGKLLVMTTDSVKSGRPQKIKNRHVVLSGDQYNTADSYLEKNSNNVPDRLLRDAGAYEESDELFQTQKVPEADLQIQTYEQMKKKAGVRFSEEYNGDTNEYFFVGKQEVQIGDIKNAEDKKLLDSMALGYAHKINSQKYTLKNGLYRDQKKSLGNHEINDRISLTSVYDEVREERKKRDIISPEAVAKINRDGPSWSEDMDDVTLRRYFIRTGLEREERRRELVLNELDGNEITFHYSGSMRDHTSDVDENYRALGYSLGFGYDLHLSRSSMNLKNWSLQFVVEIGVADYDVGGQNARGQEGFYGAYLNYYLINNPLTLNSFIWLAGVGLKVGSVEMQSGSFSKDYSYQALALPAMQLMTKYRFRTGDLTEDTVNVGASLNAGVMLDSKRLSILDPLEDNINGKISVNDLKYVLGMSVYF